MKFGKPNSKKRRTLQDLYVEGAKVVHTALISLRDAIYALCELNREKFQHNAELVLQAEHELDVYHDEIVIRLYSRESLVFSREDRVHLINGMDDIVDSAENALRRALVWFPDSISSPIPLKIGGLMEKLAEIGRLVEETFIALFRDFDKALILAEQVKIVRRSGKSDFQDLLAILYEIKPDYRSLLYFDRLFRNLMMVFNAASTFVDFVRQLVAKYKL